VVNRDVPDYALMLGVPARRAGWMSRHGHRLTSSQSGELFCPESGWRYIEGPGEALHCLDWAEDADLPEGVLSS
jgi:UDP-2-acetamido-3-amino-2,3-dideoxy-glucuronate N-acetyltransferase